MESQSEKQEQPKIQALDPENKTEELTGDELDEISGGFFVPALPFDARHKLISDVFIIIHPPFP